MASFLLKFFSNTCKDEETNYTEAHLGEDNSFYYNEDLKRWVVRGEEDHVKEEEVLPPPKSPRNVDKDGYKAKDDDKKSDDVDGKVDPILTSDISMPPPTPPTDRSRKSLKSRNLYTNIPGISIKESSTSENLTNFKFPIPTQSQFTPDTNFDEPTDDLYGNITKQVDMLTQQLENVTLDDKSDSQTADVNDNNNEL